MISNYVPQEKQGLGPTFVQASQDCLKEFMYKNVTCSKNGVGNSAIF